MRWLQAELAEPAGQGEGRVPGRAGCLCEACRVVWGAGFLVPGGRGVGPPGLALKNGPDLPTWA